MPSKTKPWSKASSGRKRKRLYSGPLNKPIRILLPEILFPTGGPARRALILQELWDKFFLLFKHYGIATNDPAGWQQLAISMALDHVPGMRVVGHLPKNKRGRPRRPIFSDRQFVQLIEGIADKNRKGISNACRTAKQRKLVHGSPKTIENRYRSAKQRLAEAEFARPLNFADVERICEKHRDEMMKKDPEALVEMNRTAINLFSSLLRDAERGNAERKLALGEERTRLLQERAAAMDKLNALRECPPDCA